MKSTMLAAAAVATAALAMAPAAPQARAPLTYEEAVRCAAAYSGEALLATGERKRELVERTGLAFRRAEDLGEARKQPPAQVYDDFGKAGIALRREPAGAVKALQAACLKTAAAPIEIPRKAALSTNCMTIKAILTAGGETPAFRSISGPNKEGFTPGLKVPVGMASCSVYPAIKGYTCSAPFNLTPAAAWDLRRKLRGEIETCIGKPLLYDYTRSGKVSLARLGDAEKPMVSINVNELGGRGIVTMSLDAP